MGLAQVMETVFSTDETRRIGVVPDSVFWKYVYFLYSVVATTLKQTPDLGVSTAVDFERMKPTMGLAC